MAKSFKDLLGAGFIKPEQAPPGDVLEELRDALASKVVFRLDFEIRSTTSADRVTHGFRVVVKSLGNYTAELFKVSHKVLEFYPARISGIAPSTVDAADESELREKLGEYVTSEEFQRTIGSLLAQA